MCAQVSASLGRELLGEDPTGRGAAPSAGQTAGRVAPSPLQALGEPPSDGVPRTSLRVCPSSTRHSPRPASLGARPRKEPSFWAGRRGQAPSHDCTSPEPFGKVTSDILIYRLGLKELTLPVTPPVHASGQPTLCLFSALISDPPPSLHPSPAVTSPPWLGLGEGRPNGAPA